MEDGSIQSIWPCSGLGSDFCVLLESGWLAAGKVWDILELSFLEMALHYFCIWMVRNIPGLGLLFDAEDPELVHKVVALAVGAAGALALATGVAWAYRRWADAQRAKRVE